MSYYRPLRQTQGGDNITSSPSPLRQHSNASTSSSVYSNASNVFPPSRTSTVSSAASSGYQSTGVGHKRGLSEVSPTRPAQQEDMKRRDQDPAGDWRSARQSLRPLPQPPSASPPSLQQTSNLYHSRNSSVDDIRRGQYDPQKSSPTADASKNRRGYTNALSRADSITPVSSQRSQTYNPPSSPHGPVLSSPDLDHLKKSSTGHLRTLSKFAESGEDEDFSINSPGPLVAGLRGRRQLKRTDSTRASKGAKGPARAGGWAYSDRNWMDKQRQFLQAYEYLCHIGEAKEWIEDIIQKPIPPIVELEEALRDGITLAEVVQSFYPDQPLRIFRAPKLQFRHSDNIAHFFRFLAEVELPDLFRFELVDLYEKKNIPKVIHCIHALSWLLYKKGMVDFRIGNLVGRLEFEHHELEKMQKGLDNAGINMPNFSGMGASFGAEPEPEPEPEPVETEEERVDRELSENEASVVDFQAQVRAAIVRIALGQTMQALWDSEERLIELQSMIRGDWSRQIAEYRLSMKLFATNLQSASRGFLTRSRQRSKDEWWKERESDVVLMQSLARARKARHETQTLKIRARKEESGVRNLQAAIRGALQRQMIYDQYEETRNAGADVERLQAITRGSLLRLRLERDQERLANAQTAISILQSSARGRIVRARVHEQRAALQNMSRFSKLVQSSARGMLLRKHVTQTRNQLVAFEHGVGTLQSTARGNGLRREVKGVKASLLITEPETVNFQSALRGHLLRKQQQNELQALRSNISQIATFQAFVRGSLFRQEYYETLHELSSNVPEIVALQGLSRAMLVRIDVGRVLDQLEAEEAVVEVLQAAARGRLVRQSFAEKQRFFKENMEKVVKVQSFVRAKLQGEAYKSLTSGHNPPVGTVKGFVHLLNDSDFDFDEEVEFERLRKTVVQHVRQNEMADQYIAQLDIKIALLVKNKITLDEVVKHQRHFGGDAGRLLTNSEMASKDPFDLKALNKTSRRKLEHYQELFFVLQTQPQYLARLSKRIREKATAEKECEHIRHLIMGLFGYAQKRREEYYLIKLITRSIKEEVDSCASVRDYLRGNFFWSKLFSAYAKSPRDRKYMRDLLGSLVRECILENPELDLESDPMQIYLSAIENEQLRTGQRSHRSPDIPREEAIKDEETRDIFVAHLQDLRDIADQFFDALEGQLVKLPYGIRYIAQQMFQYLTARFQHEEKGYMLQIVGHWVWKAYLQPALTEPEKFGVIDRGLSREHRRNLGEVAKVIGQAAAGRLFGGENVFLQPLNSYVGESIERLGDIWSNLIDVPNAEAHFDIDEFNDLYARTKPTLYIKMADIFSIHHLLVADVSYISPSQDDVLREVIRELGSAKSNENELMNVSSSEICLTLNPKLHDVEDPDAEIKSLFMETKRCILYIIRVQSGPDLMDIMVKPISMEDEDRWDNIVRDELSSGNRKRGAYAEANTLIDIASMSYVELKRTALENIIRLEKFGRITHHNHYQDLLNAIAVDIRTKHRRRIQRQRELEGVRLTLGRLNDQTTYLEQQLKTYNDYIEQAMVTLQNKKGKKRFLLPFTKQWDHERELARAGRTPKFGSYKYSAQELANRGILVSWKGYSERQWNQIDMTISSNEVGIFSIEGSMGSIAMPGATAQVPLDDLLQAQFNNTQFLEFFGNAVRLNVNLFLHLIMRKFYKDKD